MWVWGSRLDHICTSCGIYGGASVRVASEADAVSGCSYARVNWGARGTHRGSLLYIRTHHALSPSACIFLRQILRENMLQRRSPRAMGMEVVAVSLLALPSGIATLSTAERSVAPVMPPPGERPTPVAEVATTHARGRLPWQREVATTQPVADEKPTPVAVVAPKPGSARGRVWLAGRSECQIPVPALGVSVASKVSPRYTRNLCHR